MGAMSTQAHRSYRPGGWFGIFGDHATVLLPPSEKSRVAALWELVDDGAGFDEVLDALLSSGLRDLPGFVLVSPVEQGTKVVLRGAAVAVFVADGETVEVLGSTETTWVERSLPGVSRMSIQVEDGADAAESLTIAAGLVRLSRVDEPAYVDEQPPEAEPAPVDEPVDEPIADPVAESIAEPIAEPVGQHAAEPLGEPEHHEPVADPGLDETVLDQPAVEVPILEDPVDQPAQDLPPSGPVARLVFSTGEVVDVDRMVLVGRAPEPRRYTLTEEPTLVHVTSPHQEISATHLEVRPGSGPELGSAVVTDLGSTNGTVLIQPGRHPEDLHPGISVALVHGAIIDLGDGVSIQVTSA
jgi:hypothetical protein